MTGRVLCSATTADGQPCRGPARPSGLCFTHDPALAEARKAGAAEGGRKSSRAERARRVLPAVFERLETALAEVHEGKLPPQRATAMAALAGALVRLTEAGELVLRLDALEQRLRGDDNVMN